MEQSFDSVLDRIKLLEEKLEKGVVVSQSPSGASGESKQAAPPQEKKPVILTEALPEDLKAAAQNWKSIITQIGRKAPSLVSILNNTTLSIDGNQGLLLVVTEQIDKDFLDRENHMNMIKDTLAQMFQKQIQVSTKYLDRSKERLDDVPDLSKLIKMPIQYE
jgi:DNA polymerase-3 subunit gamma/tau